MGTKFVEERTAAGLFNCAFRSTKDISTKGGYLFRWMMDALMVGIGVGFDTLGAGTLAITEPIYTDDVHIIDDSREGWVRSVQVLLDGFLTGKEVPKFDYSAIRPLGAPIKGFGGTSSGHGPLKELHENLTELLTPKVGEDITSIDIVDIENLIGRCVVAGNVCKAAATCISILQQLGLEIETPLLTNIVRILSLAMFTIFITHANKVDGLELPLDVEALHSGWPCVMNTFLLKGGPI